ncbi:hypothetical protein C4J81_04230 [Deltaproteobacteria bacterium Smac51]|nr:hypothetical protein C4J81_04230 [Deltaproteobacteria bacterium Smac51]
MTQAEIRRNFSRRNFLKLAAGAAAVVGLKVVAPSQAFSSEKPSLKTLDKAAIEREIKFLRETKHSCSQATFVGICKALGNNLPVQTLLALSSGFAGGIGKTFDDGTCGALVGGVMALGHYHPGQNDETVTLAKDLFERFKVQEGTVVCKDILARYNGFSHCTDCCLFVGGAFADILQT